MWLSARKAFWTEATVFAKALGQDVLACLRNGEDASVAEAACTVGRVVRDEGREQWDHHGHLVNHGHE